MADHATSNNPLVQAQLDRFAQLSPGRDILGLERIAALMAALGNPHLRLPPVFHVAGTNGKGSTCAFLRAAIEAAGLTTHVYTSPHLVHFNERIRLAGKLIKDELLASLLAEVLDTAQAQDLGPSFFEATTAAAFLAFARTPADACIIEVGLGGRLDATNIIQAPLVCGIASLGIDHEAFLLAPEIDTPNEPLARIGWEKAGIAKSGIPLITQIYPAKVAAAIDQQARSAGADVYPRKIGWDAVIDAGKLYYHDNQGSLTLPLPIMAGAHQADNAALSVAMLRHQSALDIPESAFAAAMERAYWPARLQRLGTGPLTALLPASEIWLDGGHNPNAGIALAHHFENAQPHSIDLIIAMLAVKDPAAIIAPLLPKLASITAVQVPGHECHGAQSFADVAGDIAVLSAIDARAALGNVGKYGAKKVLIAGSLYLAGEVLKLNGQEPD